MILAKVFKLSFAVDRDTLECVWAYCRLFFLVNSIYLIHFKNCVKKLE